MFTALESRTSNEVSSDQTFNYCSGISTLPTHLSPSHFPFCCQEHSVDMMIVYSVLLVAFFTVAQRVFAQSNTGSPSPQCPASANYNQLVSSTECASICGTTDLCIAPAPSTNSTALSYTCNNTEAELDCVQGDICDFVCIDTPVYEFSLLIPFGVDTTDTKKNKSHAYSIVSSDVIHSIGNLSLESTVHTVYVRSMSGYNKDVFLPYCSRMAGGSSWERFDSSSDVKLLLTDSFIQDQTQVETVAITNLELIEVTDRLGSLMPVSLKHLSLECAGFRYIPAYLTTEFPSLSFLYAQEKVNLLGLDVNTSLTCTVARSLAFNLITDVSLADGGSLQTLYVHHQHIFKYPYTLTISCWQESTKQHYHVEFRWLFSSSRKSVRHRVKPCTESPC